VARPLAGEAAAVMMTEGRGFANVRANADLGWQRQGFKQALA
jgi:hypothetical protein